MSSSSAPNSFSEQENKKKCPDLPTVLADVNNHDCSETGCIVTVDPPTSQADASSVKHLDQATQGMARSLEFLDVTFLSFCPTVQFLLAILLIC